MRMQKVIQLVIIIFMATFVGSCAHTPFSYRQILPRKSFVKIEKDLAVKSCVTNKKTKKVECKDRSFGAFASGVVIQNTLKGAYVLTAAHVCDDSDTLKQFKDLPNVKISINFHVVTLESDKRSVKVLDFNNKHDICLLWVENLFAQPVSISPSAPKPGDRVFNIAAPLGVFSENMVPIFQGFYNGIDSKGRANYSLPAFGGSSGSPIFNARGELVGMVHSTIRYFNQIALSPNYKAMRTFINRTIDKDISNRFFRSLWGPFLGI